MKQIKYLFFDLDGTLVDSSKGIKESFNYTFKELDKKTPDEAILDSFIGPPLEVSLASVVNEKELDKAISLYRAYYKEHGVYGVELYSGVKDLLKKLKEAGFHLYVTTSKHEPISREMLVNLGIMDQFEGVFGSRPDAFHKADVLRRALQYSKAPLQEAIIIGDTKFDMIGGKEVGISTLGVLWGFGSKKELQDSAADFLADSPQQVMEILTNNAESI